MHNLQGGYIAFFKYKDVIKSRRSIKLTKIRLYIFRPAVILQHKQCVSRKGNKRKQRTLAQKLTKFLPYILYGIQSTAKSTWLKHIK